MGLNPGKDEVQHFTLRLPDVVIDMLLADSNDSELASEQADQAQAVMNEHDRAIQELQASYFTDGLPWT